ncbi:MAG: hypothetical protein ACYC46_02410 [Acidobacteriaceae bacterium]
MQFFLRFAAILLLGCACVAQTAHYDRPLHRTDLFVAGRYGDNTVLLFFSNEGLAAGVPLKGEPLPHPLPGPQSAMVAASSRLSAAQTAAEIRTWYADWPANGAPAPHVGDRFDIEIGGTQQVQANLRTLAFLPACGSTWLVGIAEVAQKDRVVYRAGFRSATGGPWGGFLAHEVKASQAAVSSTAATPLLGPVLLSTDKNFPLSTADRAKIERILKDRLAAEYATLLGERQAMYQQTHPTPFAQVEGSSTLLKGKARLVYLLQKVTVAPGTERYYVRAEWRSGSKSLYFLHAWFTPSFALDFFGDSGVPDSGAADDFTQGRSSHHAGRILNVFVNQVNDVDGKPTTVYRLLMQQSDVGSTSYVVMQWSPGALLPIGTYFGDGC